MCNWIVFKACFRSPQDSRLPFRTQHRFLKNPSRYWIPHLDIVAPLWPLKSSEPPISAPLILPYWFSSIPALAIFSKPPVSFCTATIKITGRWKMPPRDHTNPPVPKSSLHWIWMFKGTTWNMRRMRTKKFDNISLSAFYIVVSPTLKICVCI